MSVVLDTSAVLAFMVAEDDFNAAATAFFAGVDEDLVTTPVAIAEMDHLVTQRGGLDAAQVLWSNFEDGAFTVRWWADAMSETLAIARAHPRIGLADASLVALAGLLRTNRIATFDTNFRSLTTPRGDSFRMLPHDA